MTLTQRLSTVRNWRSNLVGELTGDILEVGVGTGPNLAHYRSASQLWALQDTAGYLDQVWDEDAWAQQYSAMHGGADVTYEDGMYFTDTQYRDYQQKKERALWMGEGGYVNLNDNVKMATGISYGIGLLDQLATNYGFMDEDGNLLDTSSWGNNDWEDVGRVMMDEDERPWRWWGQDVDDTGLNAINVAKKMYESYTNIVKDQDLIKGAITEYREAASVINASIDLNQTPTNEELLRYNNAARDVAPYLSRYYPLMYGAFQQDMNRNGLVPSTMLTSRTPSQQGQAQQQSPTNYQIGTDFDQDLANAKQRWQSQGITGAELQTKIDQFTQAWNTTYGNP